MEIRNSDIIRITYTATRNFLFSYSGVITLAVGAYQELDARQVLGLVKEKAETEHAILRARPYSIEYNINFPVRPHRPNEAEPANPKK